MQHIKDTFAEKCDTVLTLPICQKPEMYFMMIADPFNKMYNVAKVLNDSVEASLYVKKFKSAYVSLVSGEGLGSIGLIRY